MATFPMRGRLIRPLTIEVERIDAAATKASDGFDPIFQEPIVARTNAGRVNEKRTDGRKYKTPIRLLAQIERGPFKSFNMQPTGNVAKSRIQCVVHRRDLEKKGWLLSTGEPDFHVGDRLLAIYNMAGNKKIESIADPPGLYLTEVMRAGEGLGGDQNLLVLVFEDREQAGS